MPGIKSAGMALSRLSLAMLALCLSHPSSATDPHPSIQTLQWGGDASDDASTGGAPADVEQNYDVWQRIRSGFKINDDPAEIPLVRAHESWYAARPDYVQRIIDRSRSYLFHIVEEIDRRAMPMEIALLPMIESAFKPTALSPSAASGIWQFMPSTARLYGLKQDSWYDGRRDFTAATQAALDYLGKLYLDFGDWQLALAAYNCGEGCVMRAIQKNVQQGLPTDYASLPLPNETRHYVPKLLAIRNLILNPERYGLAITTLPNQPYFNQVTVHANMDVQSAARLAGMSSAEFLALNAAFPRKLIRSDTPVNLLVPVDKADKFQRNLEAGNWDSWHPYAAKKGERPEAIAQRFNVSLERLQELNQFQLKHGRLARAQTLLVPVKGRSSMAAPPAPAADNNANDALHTVQPGETLFSIARRYGLSVADLSQANPDLGTSLKAGQTLRLPAKEATDSQPDPIQRVGFQPALQNQPQPVRYLIQRGDTLHAIAQRYGVKVSDIRAWNPDLTRSTVHPGQTLTVQMP